MRKIIFFLLLILVFFSGCSQGKEENVVEEEVVVIEEEMDDIDFILSVLEKEEFDRVVLLIDEQPIKAHLIADHIQEMKAKDRKRTDREFVEEAIARISALIGTDIYFNEREIFVAEEEIDGHIGAIIEGREELENFDDFYALVLEKEGKTKARIRQDIAYIIKKDKLYALMARDFYDDVSEEEMRAAYEDYLNNLSEEIEPPAYEDMKMNLFFEVIRIKLFEREDEPLGEITENLIVEFLQ